VLRYREHLRQFIATVQPDLLSYDHYHFLKEPDGREKDGKEYLNVHTQTFPGGEIRGFLVQTPEPATILIFGFGLAGLGFMRRKRLSQTPV
jgi:hypothetical protein